MDHIGRWIIHTSFANKVYDVSFRFQLNFHPDDNRMIRKQGARNRVRCAYNYDGSIDLDERLVEETYNPQERGNLG